MRWLLGLVLAGCTFHQPADHGGGDDAVKPPDTPMTADAEVDGPANLLCLGSGNFRVCIPPPQQPFAVVGATNTGIDTDTQPNPCIFIDQPAGQPKLCVIAGTTINIDANILFAGGSHPLVLFATTTLEIGNGVDVGSHINGQAIGAGFDSVSCVAGSGAGSNNSGGGGGAGGSFSTNGGTGGDGGNHAANGDAAGATSIQTTFLRGGCKGGNGGNGDPASGGGGNHGGGAVLLLAGTSITITGFVNASGGGGSAGKSGKGGGGGGGSGGMIAMSSQAVNVSGQLVANGGGGGGGGDGGQAGANGHDPIATMPAAAAGGGSGAGGATAGAAGATQGNTAGNTPDSQSGAGGGGGGLGQIRILSGQTVGGTSSPTPLTQ